MILKKIKRKIRGVMMSKYQTKVKVVNACQFLGHEKPFKLEGVELKKWEGLSGYEAKMGYIEHLGRTIRVRPMHWVVKDGDEIVVLTPTQFADNYEKAIDRRVKRRSTTHNVTKAAVKDNAEESRPYFADQAELKVADNPA